MNIIIPMAGMGKRMRPHTLVTPKPLVKVGGKTIVEHLVNDITNTLNEKVEEIAFIIGDFGIEVEEELLNIAKLKGAIGKIYHQHEPLGTAHAILCAKDALKGKTVVAFADTLFRSTFNLKTDNDGVIWVKPIENPSAFGVVKVNSEGIITDFIEKPTEPVSNLAIIGIYYFKDGENLKNELQYLIDNNITEKGEFQLTNALENMKNKGIKLVPQEVEEWLDCGNKDATVYTNQRVLEFHKDSLLQMPSSLKLENSLIIQPCFIGEDVTITNSIVGPHVSLSENSVVENSIISNSIIYNNTNLKNQVVKDSMIGNNVNCIAKSKVLNIGDYTQLLEN